MGRRERAARMFDSEAIVVVHAAGRFVRDREVGCIFGLIEARLGRAPIERIGRKRDRTGRRRGFRDGRRAER